MTLNLELCVRDGQAPVQASYAVWGQLLFFVRLNIFSTNNFVKLTGLNNWVLIEIQIDMACLINICTLVFPPSSCLFGIFCGDVTNILVWCIGFDIMVEGINNCLSSKFVFHNHWFKLAAFKFGELLLVHQCHQNKVHAKSNS